MAFNSRRPLLTQSTAVAAVIVGLIMLIGGVGLVIALLATRQPTLQVLTACVLMAAGAINLQCSRGIRNDRVRPLVLSALATTVFLAYSGAALRDFGELFWMSAALLLLLAVLGYRGSLNPSPAA